MKRRAELAAALAEAGALGRRGDGRAVHRRAASSRSGFWATSRCPVGEIIPQHELFDYECKYTPGMSEEIFPARARPEARPPGAGPGADGAPRAQAGRLLPRRLSPGQPGGHLLPGGEQPPRDDGHEPLPPGRPGGRDRVSRRCASASAGWRGTFATSAGNNDHGPGSHRRGDPVGVATARRQPHRVPASRSRCSGHPAFWPCSASPRSRCGRGHGHS